MTGEYPEMRRLQYGEAIFVPVCKGCGRFVKADAEMQFRRVPDTSYFGSYTEPVEPNANCKKCGRTSMIWEGYL